MVVVDLQYKTLRRVAHEKQVVWLSSSPSVSFSNMHNEQEGGFSKRTVALTGGLGLLSPSVISPADTERQKRAPCLPLSGFGGLGCLDGASILGDVPLLQGRSISDGQREDHRLLGHGDDLLVCPLLAQVLFGVIKALHRLQRGNRFALVFSGTVCL